MELSLNVGGLDRAGRLVMGVILIALAFFEIVTGTVAIIAYVLAAIALITGLIGFCPLNALFGINTCKK